LGKTEWARSYGRHIYMEGVWNLSVWDKEAEYLLLDDVPFKKMGDARKGLWGGERLTRCGAAKLKKKQTCTERSRHTASPEARQ